MNITMKRVVLIISVALMFVMISASSYAATVTYSASAMADQGLTGTRTLKGLATSIGSSKQATIVLSHTSSGNTTTYSMSQSVTLTSNITLKIEKGAVLSIAAGKILTINGTLDAGEYQIFSGAGTISLSGSVKAVYPEWFGLSTSASGVNNITYLNSAISAVAAGGKIRFASGVTYPCEGQWTISKAVTVEGYGTELTWDAVADAATNQGIVVTASNAHVYGLKVTGVQADSFVATQVGIHVMGTDNHATGAAPTYISNNKVKDCEATGWAAGGIVIENADSFVVADNYIHDGLLYGVATFSAKYGTVSHNIVDNIDLGGLKYCYGFVATYRSFTGYDTTSAPASSNIIFSDNVVMNIDDWEAYDTHGGIRISFLNNHAYDVRTGLVMGSYDNVDGDVYPLQYCKAIGNTFYTTLATTTYGITDYGFFDGSGYAESTIIENNTVVGFGIGLRFRHTKNAKYSNNRIIASEQPIVAAEDYENAHIIGNTLSGGTSGIFLESAASELTENSGVIENNIVSASLVGINNNVYSANQNVIVRNNDVKDATNLYKNIGYTNWQLYTNTTQVSTSGTGEDTLMFLVTRLPATLIMNVKASGVKTDSGSTNKTIKFYYGASSVTCIPTATDTNDWQFEATIIQTEAAVQKIFWKGISGTSVVASGYEDWTEDTSAGQMFIKFTGESASSDGVIKQEMMILERKYQ